MQSTIRICNDCHEKPAAPHRNICWSCKFKRHMALHPESAEKTNIRRAHKYKTNTNNFRTKHLKHAENYRNNHREQARAASTQWREQYPERHRASHQAWRAKNPERIKRNSQLYALLNPDKIRINHKLRKARVRHANIGTITAPLWRELVEYFGYCCAYCLQPMDVVTMDHLTPIACGGLHDISNVVPACGLCNVKKYTKNLLEMLLYPDRRRFTGIGTPLPLTRMGRPPKTKSLLQTG